MDIGFCPECHVPDTFVQAHEWLNNGDIVQRASHENRLAFFECENFDPLFENIGEIIGVSIEHLIINITARAFERYLEQIITPEIREMIQSKKIDTNIIVKMIANLAQIAGHGKYEWIGYRYENDADDFAKQRVTEPFSVILAAGGFAGAIAASVGGEHGVTYEEVEPGVYELTTGWSKYPAVLKEKLRLGRYVHKDGQIELERCGTCGGPKKLSEFQWLLDRGIIVNRQTGRRMAMLGPAMLDTIFTALEAEIDETIPQVVVEAQRRFVKTGFYPLDILKSEEELRTNLALRGLGNLRHLDYGQERIRLRVDNTCLHLLFIGMVQGTFELTSGKESKLEWERSKEGDLEMEVTAK